MARKPRLDLAGVPQHIVQRGNNRAPCFFDNGDRRAYLDLLRESARAADVSVHAYALMTNHTHLLGTPREAGRISAMMQALGRRYVQWINKRRSRTGTLFDGRFKASLVDSERYLLCCYRYIELNPVRAGLAAGPVDYPWSSYRCNALGQADELLTPHATITALGETPDQRQSAYRAFVAEGVSAYEREAIRDHLMQGRALGSAEFQAQVEAVVGRPASLVARGRPRKKNGSDPFSGE